MKPHYIFTPFGLMSRGELELDKAYELAFTQHRYRNLPKAVGDCHMLAIKTEYDYFLSLFARKISTKTRGHLQEIAKARRLGVAHGKEAATYIPGHTRHLKARK